jgi:hypothetical protein
MGISNRHPRSDNALLSIIFRTVGFKADTYNERKGREKYISALELSYLCYGAG